MAADGHLRHTVLRQKRLQYPIGRAREEWYHEIFQQASGGWARGIRGFRNEAKATFEDAFPVVYFRLLHQNNDHFTLLEVNEREEQIRHYDSMADNGVIDGILELTRVGRLMQVTHSS